jgi:hypothetical protein
MATRTLNRVITLSAALVASGGILIAVGVVWLLRTRRVRALWRRTGRDIDKLAIMLELEERVREVESSAANRPSGG